MKADTEILPWKAFFAPSLEQDCCLQGQEGRTGFHQAAPRDISCVDWACSFPLQILQRAGEYSLNTEHSRNFFCRMRDYGTALEEADGLQSQVASCIPIFSCLAFYTALLFTEDPNSFHCTEWGFPQGGEKS